MRSVAMARKSWDDLIHESLRPSVLAAMDVGYSREAAMKHASFILKSKTPLLDAELNRILRDDVLQNVEQSKKANYLAAIVANLLRTMHGADPVDRDSSINKRVDTGGTKFADLFRDFYTSPSGEHESHGQRIQCQARRGYTRFKLITNRNVRQILQARIVTDGMRRGMKGMGRSLVKQQMVSFTMYRGTLCTVVCPTCRVWLIL
jgi:DNA-directed RNA polymerase beta subunit